MKNDPTAGSFPVKCSKHDFTSQAKAKVPQKSARIVDHQGTEGPFLCKLGQHVDIDVGGSCKSTTCNAWLLVWNLQHVFRGLPAREP